MGHAGDRRAWPDGRDDDGALLHRSARLGFERGAAPERDQLVADRRGCVEADRRQRGIIDRALEDAKTRLSNESADASELDAAYNTLVQASHKLAEVIYKQAGDQGAAGGPGGEPDAGASAGSNGRTADDDVIDAEYVDVDDKQ